MIVRIEFFKDSGKFYSSNEYESEARFEKDDILIEAITRKDFIPGMVFTIEASLVKGGTFMKYLIRNV